MLALIRKHKKNLSGLLVLCCVSTFVSCATQDKTTALVNDPTHKPESSIPWNQQEKWEATGGFPEQLSEPH
jgi:hypothetical protein